jgi:acyl-CoA synthetase (AMP-forming)/AMP-acid ligase II
MNSMIRNLRIAGCPLSPILLNYEGNIGWKDVFDFLDPLTHGGYLRLRVLLRKCQVVILEHFDFRLFFEAVKKEGVTAAFLVPTIIYALLDYPDLDKYDLRHCKPLNGS